MGFVFKPLDRMSGDKMQSVRDDSRRFLRALETHEKV
jgi:hypothetical protein